MSWSFNIPFGVEKYVHMKTITLDRDVTTGQDIADWLESLGYSHTERNIFVAADTQPGQQSHPVVLFPCLNGVDTWGVCTVNSRRDGTEITQVPGYTNSNYRFTMKSGRKFYVIEVGYNEL